MPYVRRYELTTSPVDAASLAQLIVSLCVRLRPVGSSSTYGSTLTVALLPQLTTVLQIPYSGKFSLVQIFIYLAKKPTE